MTKIVKMEKKDPPNKSTKSTPRRKLTASQVDELVDMVRAGTTHAKAGWHLGITADQVRRVLERKQDEARKCCP